MPKRHEIRCEHLNGTGSCGRFLGEVTGGKVRIFCPDCKSFHELYITDLLADMTRWVAEIQRLGGNQFLDQLQRD